MLSLKEPHVSLSLRINQEKVRRRTQTPGKPALTKLTVLPDHTKRSPAHDDLYLSVAAPPPSLDDPWPECRFELSH